MLKKKVNYVKLSAQASGRSPRDLKKEIERVQMDFGITPKEYYTNKYYEMSPTQQARKAGKIIKDRNRRQGYIDLIHAETGLGEDEIHQIIRDRNKLGIFNLTLFLFTKFELYKQTKEEQIETIKLLARRKELRQELAKGFEAVDAGQLTYDDLSDQIEEFYDIHRRIMPESFKQEMADAIAKSRPEVLTDRDLFEQVTVDMEATRNLLRFTTGEYISFHFSTKTIPEKREFINEQERTELLGKLNDMSKADNLDNKYLCYSALKEYYGRKMILAESMDDFDKFQEFCEGLDEFVKKPISDSLGRGIELIAVDRDNLQAQFAKLLEENNTFIAEECIVPHEAIRALHPGSVNTIRLITYFDGEKTIIQYPFMKIGQGGAFIDNGGAGGILASIDADKGFISTDGIDENGVIYKVHPDTGITLKGYQLPDWESAIQLGNALSNKIPGFCYIGWDITYTADNKWIIVEGNSKTQFFGQQSTTDTGVKKAVLQTVSGSIKED